MAPRKHRSFKSVNLSNDQDLLIDPTAMASQRNPAFASLNVEDIDISEDFPIDNGGDFILCSIDATYFSVHRLILSLASPVFGDMLNIGTDAQKTATDAWTSVAEDAATLGTLLKCIYPSKNPPVLANLEHIALVLRAAHKYEIPKAMEMMGKEITLVPRPVADQNQTQTQNQSLQNRNRSNIARSTVNATHLTEHPLYCYALGRLYNIPSLREAAVKAAAGYIRTQEMFDVADAGCKEVDAMPTAWFRDFKKESMAAYSTHARCFNCNRDYF
ncbi:hypothetical protein HGRIS_004243 [Hohenbuehelia grisea]|uniref:BTB domain-containing protein n=1 Tax=Hohenbuehelia grisea TaxID=104357 RepID=A0ABR3IP75_9AGAR